MHERVYPAGVRVAIALAIVLLIASASRAQTGFQYLKEIGNGTGSALGQFDGPSSIAIGDIDRYGRPDIFVADTGNNRVQRITFSAITGDPDFDLIAGPGTDVGQVMQPKGIDVDSQRGLLFVADTGNNRIQRATFHPVTGDPDFDLIAGFGTQLGQVNAPEGVAFSGGGDGTDPTQPDLVYIADTGNNRIQLGTRNAGSLIFDWRQLGGPGTDLGQFNQPSRIIDPGDDSEGTRDRPPMSECEKCIIADTGNNRIQRLTMNHVTGDLDFDLLNAPPGGWSAPEGVAFIHRDSDNNGVLEPAEGAVFVGDTDNSRIQLSFDNGLNWSLVAGPGSGHGQVMNPRGIVLGDLTGDGLPDLVVADTGNDRLLVFAGVPEPSTVALAVLALTALGSSRQRPPVA
jgi:hypothetical protein